MKQIFLLSFLFFFCLFALSAQEVLSSAGMHAENATGALSWTIGEPISATIPGSEAQLTQGFHQPLPNPDLAELPTMSQWLNMLYGLLLLGLGMLGIYRLKIRPMPQNK